MSDLKPSIILVDGICNLCNGFVQFIIKRDSKERFLFSALQSHFGQQKLEELGYNKTDFHSLILLENGRHYEQSTAVLRISKRLTGLWPLLYVFIIIPKPIRDAVYRLVAHRRYRLFGKKDYCMLPTPALKRRFVSEKSF